MRWRENQVLQQRVARFLNDVEAHDDVEDIQYGPGDDDIRLFMPFRHPGNLRYQGAIQAAQIQGDLLNGVLCRINQKRYYEV